MPMPGQRPAGRADEGSGRPGPAAPVAPPILSGVPGSFARGVFHERHPALLRQVGEAFPYGPDQRRALAALEEESTGGVIAPLDPAAHDHRLWETWGVGYFGRPWAKAPFLWAESYFYRRMLDAVGYFGPGPWRGIDPFAPFKHAELHGAAVDGELAALEDVAVLPDGERDTPLVRASLWGNRADLGFRITAGATPEGERAAALVADDGALLWSLLDERAPGRVCLVADNAGSELLPDLVLIDHLLATGRAAEAVLHVKPYPYYVSDATTADVVGCLRRMVGASGQAGQIGGRLWRAMETGRLVVRAHAFFCAPLPYRDMPGDLRDDFAACSLTVMKGDLNYRRLVGDRAWPASTPFADLTAYFPAPVAALRTLKSDVVAGLDARTVAALDATGEPWRTGGTHALIQVRA